MSTVSIAEASRQLSQIVNRASYGHEVVVLTSRGKPKAVVVGVETFQELLKVNQFAQTLPMPEVQFSQEFHQELSRAGYDTPEKIVTLVREVKQEMDQERQGSAR
jgi:prevent-host-death family protein